MKIKLFIFAVLLSVSLAGCTNLYQPETETQETQQTEPTLNQITEYSFTAQEAITALELTTQNVAVTFDEYDFGVLVTGVNGLAADDGHYWALYLNDEYATAGASQVELQSGDTITWKYEAISAADFSQ